MSSISKIRTALGVVFILTSAGAISVSAQTQTATGSYPTSTIVRPDSTTQPKKVDAVTPLTALTENTALPDKTAEVNVEKDAGGISAVSALSTPTEPRSETTSAPRAQPAPDDKWQFQVTPYFWLASLHGVAGVGIDDVART